MMMKTTMVLLAGVLVMAAPYAPIDERPGDEARAAVGRRLIAPADAPQAPADPAVAEALGARPRGHRAAADGTMSDAASVGRQRDLEAEGYDRILRRDRRGRYSKHGWNHYGPGWFELDRETGVLTAHGGMGLLWYSAEQYGDFVLELDFLTEEENANSGIFLRVPEMPTSDEYIYHSFEVQIHDASEGVHTTGAVYDAEPATAGASNGPGAWNHFKITFQGDRIEVELNGTKVVDWQAEPRGKIRDFAPRGYIGLQNHDWDTTTRFRDIFVKKLE